MEIYMIELKYIHSLEWNKRHGNKLKKLKGEATYRSVAQKANISAQLLKEYEDGKIKSIKPSMLHSICEAIECDITDFYPFFIFIPATKRKRKTT